MRRLVGGGPEVMRIAVLGNSGSGKSTLARWLADRGGAALLDLDTVAWEPDQIAVARAPEAAAADVREFCARPHSWVVEGCYSDLVSVALEFHPRLLFLSPGEAQCIANCRSRPWEPHKYKSKEEQDERLHFLLSWVRQYYTREGPMSLSGHLQCYLAYHGPKEMVTALPLLSPASPQAVAWLR